MKFWKIQKKKKIGGGGGGSGWGGGGGQDRCERGIEVFVKIQKNKKKFFWGGILGGGGVGVGLGGGGGSGWM